MYCLICGHWDVQRILNSVCPVIFVWSSLNSVVYSLIYLALKIRYCMLRVVLEFYLVTYIWSCLATSWIRNYIIDLLDQCQQSLQVFHSGSHLVLFSLLLGFSRFERFIRFLQVLTDLEISKMTLCITELFFLVILTYYSNSNSDHNQALTVVTHL